jgi:hypothetical protein
MREVFSGRRADGKAESRKQKAGPRSAFRTQELQRAGQFSTTIGGNKLNQTECFDVTVKSECRSIN